MNIEPTLAQLRKEFPSPALSAWQVVEILKRCGLGSKYEYRRWKDEGLIKPLKKVGVSSQNPRFSRESVLEVVAECLTES